MIDDDPALVEAARAIASGEAVDWPALESSAGGESSRHVLRALEEVAGIAAFHRSRETAATPARVDDTPDRWGTLSVVRQIGRGAFGRVYLAWDPSLNREVALKILDPHAGSHTGRDVVEEGRHLARLRHPNIVSIHRAGSVDGRVGLEMELITGRTLTEIVRKDGPLGADEALLIGRDVCRALAAVHRAGLVHRDVKAQNVIREQGGRIVLMDLGAGRPFESPGLVEAAGTPLYLAPEVLSGSPPTPRSDLYSLGVLLYFLATGAFPVSARTLDELRARHRDGAFGRLRDVRPDLPESFIHLVESALAPDPANRISSAGRFEAELSQALGHADRRAPAAAGPRRWALAAAGAIALTGSLALWGAWPRPGAGLAIERFVVPLDGALTLPGGPGAREFSLSPDGASLAYATSQPGRPSHILVRKLNDVEPRIIENTGDAGRPFYSPDGLRVGFHQSTPSGGRLVTVGIDGSALLTVAEWPGSGGAAWGRDGTIVFSRDRDLWRVAETGGREERLTDFAAASRDIAMRPEILPNGSILFTIRRDLGATSEIAVRSVDGSIRTLVKNATSAKYLPAGYLVFVAGDPAWIMAAAFDRDRLSLTGPAVQVQAVQSPAHWFDVSDSGSLVYSLPDEPAPQDQPRLVWVDRASGRAEPLALRLAPGDYLAHSLRVSPDQRRIAVATTPSNLLETVDSSLPGLLKVGDLKRGILGPPLTQVPVLPLAWSRDGTRITYQTIDGAIAWRRADGTGSEELLAAARPAFDCNTGEWSPDGRVLLLGCGNRAGADSRLGFMTLTFPSVDAVGRAPVEPRQFDEATPGMGPASFSPDGRWIAYSANLTGRSGGAATYVRAFPGPGPVFRISPGVGRRPVWSGSELFYLVSGGLRVAPVRTQPTFGSDPATAVFDDFSAYDVRATGGLTFDVAPDGRRFLLLKRSGMRGGDQITALTVVLHWADEVARKLAGR